LKASGLKADMSPKTIAVAANKPKTPTHAFLEEEEEEEEGSRKHSTVEVITDEALILPILTLSV